MHDARLRGAHDLRLGGAQRLERGVTVAGGDRLLDLAHERAHAAAARLVDLRALGDLARHLLGRFRVGHGYPRTPIGSERLETLS